MDIDFVFVDDVVVGERQRQLDNSKVDALAKSIEAIGLQQPISIFVDDDDIPHLIAGRHRLEAVRKLAWEQVEVSFVDLPEHERELWEIDENLMRADLTQSEKAEHIKRRREVWERRKAVSSGTSSPETPRVSRRGRVGEGRPKGFAAETAEQTGMSKRQVNRLLEEPKSKPSLTVVTSSQEDRENQMAKERTKLMRVWRESSTETQQWFLENVADKPVMDERWSGGT